MFEALERDVEWDEDTDLSLGATRKELLGRLHRNRLRVEIAVADKAIVDNKAKVTEDQLKTFMELCWVKYVKARIEPGMWPTLCPVIL